MQNLGAANPKVHERVKHRKRSVLKGGIPQRKGKWLGQRAGRLLGPSG